MQSPLTNICEAKLVVLMTSVTSNQMFHGQPEVLLLANESVDEQQQVSPDQVELQTVVC